MCVPFQIVSNCYAKIFDIFYVIKDSSLYIIGSIGVFDPFPCYCIWLVGISCPISLPNCRDDLYPPAVSQWPLYLWFRDNKRSRQQTAFISESMFVVISFIYSENNNGPRTVPRGTPDKMGTQSDFIPFTTTRCCLKQRKESILFKIRVSFNI